jgi:flagellar export protein FliJ
MNLSRLLAYRSQIEEALHIELAAAARRLQEAMERSAACEAEVTDKQRRYAEAGRTGLTVDDAHRWYMDIESASIKAARAADAHDRLHRDWTSVQADLIVAMQERKKLDILIRRRLEVLQQAQLHEDQRLMDEQAARRRAWYKNRRGAVQSGSDSHG